MSRLKYNNQIIYNARLWSNHSINDSFILKPTNLSKIKNDQNSNIALVIFDKDNSTVTSTSVQLDRQDNAFEKNRVLDDINITSEIAESKMKYLSRKKRDILKIKTQNHTTTDDKKNGNNTVDVQRESQEKKLQRGVEDVGKGQKRCKNRRRPKCRPSRRQIGICFFFFFSLISMLLLNYCLIYRNNLTYKL